MAVNNIKSVIDASVAGKIDRAGDTMDGPLVLSGAPTTDLQAATKKYVDDSSGGSAVWGSITGALADQTDLQAALDGKVDSTGGSISGALIADEFKTVKGYLHTETLTTPAASFAIHMEISLTGSPQTITTGFTQPDFARTISFSGSSQLPGFGTVTIHGTDVAGSSLSEDIDLASTSLSTSAFKTVTSLDVPAESTSGDTLLGQVTASFGLAKVALASINGTPGNLILSKNFTSDVYARPPDGMTDQILCYFTTDIT